MRTRFLIFTLFLSKILLSDLHAEDTLLRQEWKIDGIVREALVHAPSSAKTNQTPVVFAFHGHGGTMRRAAGMFRIHDVWPEAIVVYMQGLNTPGQLTDPEGKKPGWQKSPGDQNDRDLKFLDAVLKSLEKNYRVDKKRVYSTGHSNGGGFTYLLWATRGEKFAAFAPSASVGRTLVDDMELPFPRFPNSQKKLAPVTQENSSSKRAFIPKPVFHIAGNNDPLVKFEWQKMMLVALRKKNQCGEGSPWKTDKRCTIYPSEARAPVVTYIHSGLHKFPADAPELIVEFFKTHAKQ